MNKEKLQSQNYSRMYVFSQRCTEKTLKPTTKSKCQEAITKMSTPIKKPFMQTNLHPLATHYC